MTKKSLEKSMLFLFDKVIQVFPEKACFFYSKIALKSKNFKKAKKHALLSSQKVKKAEKFFPEKSMLLSFKQKRKFSKNFFEKKHAFFIWEFVQDHQKHDFEKSFLLILNNLEAAADHLGSSINRLQSYHKPAALLEG